MFLQKKELRCPDWTGNSFSEVVYKKQLSFDRFCNWVILMLCGKRKLWSHSFRDAGKSVPGEAALL